MGLGNNSERYLRNILDQLKALTTAVEKLANKGESASSGNFSHTPGLVGSSNSVPVKLDWTEPNIVGTAHILDDRGVVSIRIFLSPAESAKARESMEVAPIESLTVTNIALR